MDTNRGVAYLEPGKVEVQDSSRTRYELDDRQTILDEHADVRVAAQARLLACDERGEDQRDREQVASHE